MYREDKDLQRLVATFAEAVQKHCTVEEKVSAELHDVAPVARIELRRGTVLRSMTYLPFYMLDAQWSRDCYLLLGNEINRIERRPVDGHPYAH